MILWLFIVWVELCSVFDVVRLVILMVWKFGWVVVVVRVLKLRFDNLNNWCVVFLVI